MKILLIFCFMAVAAPALSQADAIDNRFLTSNTPPLPKGGMASFYKELSQVITYPKAARKAGIEGRVFIQFIVKADGSVTDVKVLQGIGGGCDEEAARVIGVVSASKKWDPGLDDAGKPADMRYVLPVVFKLGRK